MSLLAIAFAAALPLLLAVAAVKDVVSFTIPNWLSIAVVVAFYPAALAAGLSWGDIGMATAVGAAMLLIGLAVFYAGWMGGGDAKLAAACAVWMGWPTVLPFLLATAMAGGVLALVLMQMRSKALRPHLQRGPPWLGQLVTVQDAPYGVAIAVGALVVLRQSPIVQAIAG